MIKDKPHQWEAAVEPFGKEAYETTTGEYKKVGKLIEIKMSLWVA